MSRESNVNSGLMASLLTALFSMPLITVGSVMMALGTGLASTPEAPVSSASQAMWYISGLAFIPGVVLLLLTIGTRRRVFAVALAAVLVIAGAFSAGGWFMDAGAQLPDNTWGNVVVIGVFVIPLIAAMLLLWQARSLRL